MRLFISVVALLGLSFSAMAQDIDFGDDASRWALDGQCDDMRFEGPGMTTTMLLDGDVMHDASDCAAAYAEGRLTLVGDGGSVAGGDAVATFEPGAVFGGGTKDGAERVRPGGGGVVVAGVMFDGIDFGDDGGQWPVDGECDDRRFTGEGMAGSLNWEGVGRDASDCLAGYQAGALGLWNAEDSVAATQCDAIDFGDDDGDFPMDSECDDYRFEGRAAALRLAIEEAGHDASDCRRLCTYGVVSLRDY